MARSLLTRRCVRRSRVQIAFLLVVLAAAVFHLRDCGTVGLAAAKHLSLAIGSYGTTLLAVALFGSAVIVGTPKAIWRLLTHASIPAFRALLSGASRIFKPAIRRPDLGRRLTDHQVSFSPRARFVAAGKTVRSELPPPSFLPREHELRSALRHLGYAAREIDGVLPRLDPRKEFVEVIRDALHLLRAGPPLPT
jgi:RuvA, C-terminal domain